MKKQFKVVLDSYPGIVSAIETLKLTAKLTKEALLDCDDANTVDDRDTSTMDNLIESLDRYSVTLSDRVLDANRVFCSLSLTEEPRENRYFIYDNNYDLVEISEDVAADLGMVTDKEVYEND